MSKKKKPSSKHDRPHFVNEDTKEVFVTVDSWMGAQAAPHWVQRYYPGYKCKLASADELQKMIAKQTETTDD